jgi:hypothetical protein
VIDRGLTYAGVYVERMWTEDREAPGDLLLSSPEAIDQAGTFNCILATVLHPEIPQRAPERMHEKLKND